MDYKQEILKILEQNYSSNKQFLELQKCKIEAHEANPLTIFQAYSISNQQLKNVIDLIKILPD